MKDWLNTSVGGTSREEQLAPGLHDTDSKGKEHQASMDLVWEERGKVIWLDVTTTTAFSSNDNLQKSYVRRGRTTARAKERKMALPK